MNPEDIAKLIFLVVWAYFMFTRSGTESDA